MRGLNLGIDFKGGAQVTFSTHKAYTTDADREHREAQVNQKDAVVQGRGTSTNGNYKPWQVRTRSLTSAQQSTFQQDLEQQVGAYKLGTTNVSSSFGHQIADRRDLGNHRLDVPDRDLHRAAGSASSSRYR